MEFYPVVHKIVSEIAAYESPFRREAELREVAKDYLDWVASLPETSDPQHPDTTRKP